MIQFLGKLEHIDLFRRHVSGSGAARRCLYVTANTNVPSEVPATESLSNWTFDCTSWTDDRGPNWFLYDALILEVPPTAESLSRFSLDLEEAEAAGIPLVWLLQPRVEAATAARVLGVEVMRPRQPLTPPSASGAAAEYLAGVTEVALVLRPPPHAQPLWPVGATGRWAAGYIGRSPVRPTSVVPASDSPAIAGLDPLLRSIGGTRSRSRSTFSDSLAAYATLALVLAGIVAITFLRYQQRTFNTWYATTAGRVYTMSYLDDPEESNAVGSKVGSAGREMMSALSDPATPLTARRVASLFALGLFPQANKALERISASDNPRRCRQSEEVAEELQRQAISSLREGNRGQARFLAQLHVNLAYRLACEPQRGTARSLTRSQTLLDMTRQAYVFGDDTAKAMTLLDPITGDLPSVTSVDPSLLDNVAYAQLAQNTVKERSTPSDRVVSWTEFVQQYPTSERADEAAFNAIVAQMDQHAVSAQIGRTEWLAANEATLPMVDSFLERFSSSYLADDAALLGLRVSATLARRPLVEKYLRTLTALSTSADAIQELRARLADSLVTSVGGYAAANRLAEFVVSREALNDTMNLVAVRSGSDARAAEALNAAEALVGSSATPRSLTVSVIMRAFGPAMGLQ